MNQKFHIKDFLEDSVNTTETVFKISRLFILIIGVAVTLNGIFISLTSNFNLGNILTFLLGFALLLCGMCFNNIKESFPKWVKAVLIIAFAVILLFVSFLLVYGTNDSADYSEDAIIVLGAAVHGDVPSLTLCDRLDAAVEYHRKNPDALIVVSGGQGHEENISEALAMEKYLISKGIPENIIIKEEAAKSTYENFLYSKEILDEHFGSSYSTAFISNEYHIFRASNIAKTARFDSVSHTHSSTRWYSLLPGTLRECLAVVKFLVFGK